MQISYSDNFLANFTFQELNSKELIKKQADLREADFLIKNTKSMQNEMHDKMKNNDIKNDSEIFLIKEGLRKPLLHIANKLLGRQLRTFNTS